MSAGRPTSYEEDYADQAEKLCRLGATDVELAEILNSANKNRYLEFWLKLHREDRLGVIALRKEKRPGQFASCWALSNLQPMWAADNLRKGKIHVAP